LGEASEIYFGYLWLTEVDKLQKTIALSDLADFHKQSISTIKSRVTFLKKYEGMREISVNPQDNVTVEESINKAIEITIAKEIIKNFRIKIDRALASRVGRGNSDQLLR